MYRFAPENGIRYAMLAADFTSRRAIKTQSEVKRRSCICPLTQSILHILQQLDQGENVTLNRPS